MRKVIFHSSDFFVQWALYSQKEKIAVGKITVTFYKRNKG
jgi:hypothetical protein